jgi:hypothetical protein
MMAEDEWPCPDEWYLRRGLRFFRHGKPPSPPVVNTEEILVEFSDETYARLESLVSDYPEDFGTTVEEAASRILAMSLEDREIVQGIVMKHNGSVEHLILRGAKETVCGMQLGATWQPKHFAVEVIERTTCPHCIIKQREGNKANDGD